MLERKLLSGASQMAVSVRCVIGPDMIEGGMSNPDAMAGANGLIFLICHDSTSTELTKRRLHEVMQAKHHYGGIPVAFLMTDYVDSEKMKVDLNVGALIHDTGIRICEIFHRKPKCKSGLEDMVSKVNLFVIHNTKKLCHWKELLFVVYMKKTGELNKLHCEELHSLYSCHPVLGLLNVTFPVCKDPKHTRITFQLLLRV